MANEPKLLQEIVLIRRALQRIANALEVAVKIKTLEEVTRADDADPSRV